MHLKVAPLALEMRSAKLKMIILPHSSSYSIPIEKFVAVWKAWVEVFYPGEDYKVFCMPRRHAAQSLKESLDQGLVSCLDVMCRLITPPEYRNTMQVTDVFMAANSKWILACSGVSPARREVSGAVLTSAAISAFESCKVRKKKQYLDEAHHLSSTAKSGDYLIEEHRHRLAAWAAATAASASKLCRFEVVQGVAILEACGFTPTFSTPTHLPADAQALAQEHRVWREKAIAKAGELGLAGFTDGVAAKLINCYLKVIFVCGDHVSHPSVAILHPPIDRILLENLEKFNIGGKRTKWREFKSIGWSKFNSKQYEEVISEIIKIISGEPLWKIERHWTGHQ